MTRCVQTFDWECISTITEVTGENYTKIVGEFYLDCGKNEWTVFYHELTKQFSLSKYVKKKKNQSGKELL